MSPTRAHPKGAPPGVWLLSAALASEAEILTARLQPAGEIGRRPCWQGRLGGREVLLVLTGMGLVNAASAVTAVLEQVPGLSALVNLGCAGAYAGSGLAVGQAALASEVVLADQGVRTRRRLHGLEKTGIPLLERGGQALFNRLPCDPALSRALARPGLARGVFACVVQVSGDPLIAAEVEARWGAILEDMESGAVAQVAALYGLPFACLRGVSNLAGARELEVRAGAEAAQRALLAALGEPA